MEEKSNSQEENNGLKILLIIIAVIYGISFMPAGQGFENAKTSVRSSNGPQRMSLDGVTEFINAFSNSFIAIRAGYGSFIGLFNKDSGENMIVKAAINSHKKPYHSTSSWQSGKSVGLLFRILILVGLVIFIRKL